MKWSILSNIFSYFPFTYLNSKTACIFPYNDDEEKTKQQHYKICEKYTKNAIRSAWIDLEYGQFISLQLKVWNKALNVSFLSNLHYHDNCRCTANTKLRQSSAVIHRDEALCYFFRTKINVSWKNSSNLKLFIYFILSIFF